jgi:hypothetical protein
VKNGAAPNEPDGSGRAQATAEADLSSWEQIREVVSARAKAFARNGGSKDFLDPLAKMLGSVVARKHAEIDGRLAEREGEIHRTIDMVPARTEMLEQAAKAQDRTTDDLKAELPDLEQRVRELQEQEESLPAGQRSARLVGKEAVTAATATGLGDAAAFVLTINAIGGQLWLRVSIAVTIALVLNVGVLASARTLAGIWRMLGDSSTAVRVGLASCVTLLLGFLLYRALETAGEFRQHALINITQGLPSNPTFLVWVGLTGAFSGTIALGWWHYASEGDRLARHRRKLEAKLEGVRGAIASSLDAAGKMRDKVFEILAEAERLKSEVKRLPAVAAKLKDAERAEGDAAAAAAEAAFAEGVQQRINAEESKSDPTRTIDDETQHEIDELLKDIFGDD